MNYVLIGMTVSFSAIVFVLIVTRILRVGRHRRKMTKRRINHGLKFESPLILVWQYIFINSCIRDLMSLINLLLDLLKVTSTIVFSLLIVGSLIVFFGL